MKENILLDKTFAFSVRVVNAYKHLVRVQKEFVLSKQFLRSGTSVGAKAKEAVGVQYRNDFVSKFAIAYKEARETKYWIRLLHATGFLDEAQCNSLLRDAEEILRIIGKIQVTTKKQIRNS